MKKICNVLVALGLLLVLVQPVFGNGVETVKKALLSFEANVKWEAVSQAWRGLRSGWVSQVRNATSATQVATRLRILEGNILWSAVHSNWRGIRTGWVSATRSASGPDEVAKLLLSLEANTLWSAVQPGWAKIRPGWVDALKNVQPGI